MQQYVQGVRKCGLDWQEEQVYAIWRFVRIVLTHDYFYEWIRGKIRGLHGYESLLDSSIQDA